MNSSKEKWLSFCLFLMGLGASTKIYVLGTIGISELVAFFVAPFVFMLDYGALKRDGFMMFIMMIWVVVGSMLMSSHYNHTPTLFIIKSFAVLYSIFAHLVVFHRLVRNNYYGIGWFLLGLAVSGIISIFYFNPTAMVTDQGTAYAGDADAEAIVSGPLFWASKIVPFLTLPVAAIYLKIPLLYSLLVPFVATVLMMLTSVSGRAASLTILMAFIITLIGRKSRRTMMIIGKHLFAVVLGVFAFVIIIKWAYKYAAMHDYLGDLARSKYEVQTRTGDSWLNLLMSGRKEFFAAIPAALDRPIVGHGPFALDSNGYWERFLQKYGSIEDYQVYLYSWQKNGGVVFLPTHSYIMSFWVHYGIGGLLFWVYVVWLICCHFKKYANAVPQWYGYFALTITSFAWALFFSPFGGRANFSMMMCCLLFARAIGKGVLPLPRDMEREANKYD